MNARSYNALNGCSFSIERSVPMAKGKKNKGGKRELEEKNVFGKETTTVSKEKNDLNQTIDLEYNSVDNQEYTKINTENLDNEFIYDVADFFKVFGDSTRIKLLNLLLKKEMCVGDIADSLNMTQSAVSHQLRVLRQSDLVKYRKDGKTVYYSLDDGHVKTVLEQGMSHIQHKKGYQS